MEHTIRTGSRRRWIPSGTRPLLRDRWMPSRHSTARESPFRGRRGRFEDVFAIAVLTRVRRTSGRNGSGASIDVSTVYKNHSPHVLNHSPERARSSLRKASKSRAIRTNTENGTCQVSFFGKVYKSYKNVFRALNVPVEQARLRSASQRSCKHRSG